MWVFLLLVMAINWDALWNEFDPQGKNTPTHSPPFDKQKPFIQAALDPKIQYVSAVCGIQSGKTLGGADATYAGMYGPEPVMLPPHVRGRTPMEIWFVSKSYQLCDTQLETFRMRTPPDIWASESEVRNWGLKKGDQYTHWLKPRKGCEDQAPIKLRLRTSKDPESLRATPFLAWVWGDEATYWPEKSFLNLQGRAIVARTKFIFTTSPRGKDYVYRNLALPGGWPGGVGHDPKISSFGWSSADNPYADKKHLERLRRILGREYAKQELDGLFTDAIGYVYGMFDRSTHMVKPPSDDPDYYPIRVGGVDPGTRDAYAAGIWCRTKEGVWYQVWEFHETGGSSMRFASLFRVAQEKWKVQRWYVDRAKPSDAIDLRDAGVKAYQAIYVHSETDNKVIPITIALCRELLRAGKLFIGEGDEYTAEEFEKYHYKDESDDNPTNTRDIPVDWMNHHMDAMRYAICSVEEIPNVKPRYRSGVDQMPRSNAERPKKPVGVLTASTKDYLAAQDKRFEERERGCRRQEL